MIPRLTVTILAALPLLLQSISPALAQQQQKQQQQQQQQSKRPNVVFILTDDQRADALGIAGHAHLKTPNIDRLGREGIYFRNAFCTTSLCSPSRASILSGLYAHTHGITNNFT